MTILALALVFMIGFTVLAFQVLLWQSADISVAIVSETEEGSQEVTISVRNTAGTTLLFYENAEITGKIEYLSEDGWVEYCDVSYTNGNANAVSTLYGGTFAELEPGEDWNVIVPEDKVAGMKNGTYRIKMTYVTEKNYNAYLESAFANRNDESNESLEESGFTSEDISFDISTDSSVELPSIPDNDKLGNGMLATNGSATEKDTASDVSEEEEYLAASVSEVFVKTFKYELPEDFVSEISIEKRTVINEDYSKVYFYKNEENK